MTYLTPEAQQRLNEYLTDVRAALAGCPTVDADEIEQDICAHIAAEFPPSFGPVSKLDLEPVLARLGRPEQWVPEGEQSPLWRAAERLRNLGAEGKRVGQVAAEQLGHLGDRARRIGRILWLGLRQVPDQAKWAGGVAAVRFHRVSAQGRQAGQAAGAWLGRGPEDWRLAYIAFGLLVLGLIIPPLLIGLLPASFCAARAALTVARERDEPLGARRWLIYPPLVLVSLLVTSVVLLWPIAPGAGLAHEMWRSYRADLVAAVPFPRGATEFLVYAYCIAGTLAAWLVILGSALWAVPRLAVAVLRPFADGFGRRQAGMLVLTGLGVLALCLSLAVRVVNSDAYSLQNSANERWTYVTSVDLPRR
jgi:hypothetical protein